MALLVELGRVLKADELQVLLNVCKAISNRSKRAALHAGCEYRLLVRHPASGPVKVYEFAQHNEACEELAARHRTPQKLAPVLRQWIEEQVCIGKSTVDILNTLANPGSVPESARPPELAGRGGRRWRYRVAANDVRKLVSRYRSSPRPQPGRRAQLAADSGRAGRARARLRALLQPPACERPAVRALGRA